MAKLLKYLFPLGLILILVITALYFSQNVKFDVSLDALALTEDLQSGSYQKTRSYFGEDETIAVLISSKNPFKHVSEVNHLQERLTNDPLITWSDSYINVPLLFSPPIYLLELRLQLPNYFSERTDQEMAKKEFIENPFYKRVIMSDDYSLMSILLQVKPESYSNQAIYKRKSLLEYKNYHNNLTTKQTQEYQSLIKKVQQLRYERNQQLSALLDRLERITKKYQHLGYIYIIGLPVVTEDILKYMYEDLLYLGSLSLISMTIILMYIFRQYKPMFLIIASGLFSVIITAGIIGFLNQNLTIVSSNFPPLLFIIGLGISVYVLVRYLENKQRFPRKNNDTTILQTVRSVIEPCGYSALTTIVGFSSLLISDIKPIVDFGLIMAMGLVVTFVVCFTFLPACLGLINLKTRKTSETKNFAMFDRIIKANQTHPKQIIIFYAVLMAIFGIGITQLKVENRFVDYFKPNTNIVKGILLVDEKLAGSTSLEIVLESNEENHWISNEGREELKEMHTWLEKQNEIQKVMSFYTFDETLAQVNRGQIGYALFKMILNHTNPVDRKVLLDPYLANNNKIARLVAYIPDSNRDLVREDLIQRIENKLGTFKDQSITRDVTGVYWLYNNVLQSLYDSQIKTLLTVYLCIGIMLLLLFKNIKLVLYILIPNLIPVTLVLGTLGWAGIPLDFMTITIAAISVGLSVDFAIQFLYRYREEIRLNQPQIKAYEITFNSIGRAIFTTVTTTAIGFILFIFSNFNPLLYFGLLTSLAIISAGIATLTMIPALINTFGLKKKI